MFIPPLMVVIWFEPPSPEIRLTSYFSLIMLGIETPSPLWSFHPWVEMNIFWNCTHLQITGLEYVNHLAENQPIKKVFNDNFYYFFLTNRTFPLVFLKSFCTHNATHLMPCSSMDETSILWFCQTNDTELRVKAPLSTSWSNINRKIYWYNWPVIP